MPYSKEVYRKSLSILENRRTASLAELRKNKECLYKRNTRAREIENQLSSTAVKLAKAVINGKNVREQVKLLKNKNLSLQEELEGILEENNFPKDYLKLKHVCSACKDTGFIDGKMCECLKLLLKKQTYDELNKISPLDLCSFEDFSLDYYSAEQIIENKPAPKERMQKVLRFCRDYAENFSNHSTSLLMQGKTGLGKTHLSLAIARKVIDKGYGVIYSSAPAILSKLEKEHFSAYSSEENTLNYLLDCDLLILDDLGTEFETKFTVATIYNILNSRLLTSKPTIISTNLTLRELEEAYTQRFVSRIMGNMERLEFLGKDIRQKIKYKKR